MTLLRSWNRQRVWKALYADAAMKQAEKEADGLPRKTRLPPRIAIHGGRDRALFFLPMRQGEGAD
ncbi:UNVERIFIED_ORG: hypothetical protein BDK47_14514 [Anoxybacillus amylolyticus]